LYLLINVGSGREVAIIDLVKMIIKIVGYKGNYYFNSDMPSGQKRRVLSTKKLLSIGWKPKYSLEVYLHIHDYRVQEYNLLVQ
jgi:GDP-L-fucose synthase